MRFQVPQFINIEDKVIGPLTIKQFVYLAGGAGMSYLIYILLPFFIAVILIVIIGALSLALAFYKINNKPFVFFLENTVRYFFGGKLYIWQKKEKKPVAKQKTQEEDSLLYVPKLSDSKLKDLTWSLDVKEQANPGTVETMKEK
ncbi:MAG: hypothetical protein A3G52_00590 [Candidatus Taylorbacteria bacterium RIFCSPLOWO2_12_FULL_43_20]|uniref:PrgI family protein n=1 Tax=Candidatus Taylorbacteria bacterium RIFCSPLOWO2_12_FULL_43_20 TaxID=1802332 RepID=A0A1G2P303_9BACT|nr:MAG: hypothetical protein A2825_00400 [Candidatus Taylorbacteria bacterium RIFCSPHIGHO2_01_FULL_43_120]OHA22745.1 MAG: hypothetical protein A3B98_01065 [Candidatus Taylorbacteria bacterium RIFCSPHIGHO2_02_FULL_43_55]OHA28655.1 MAG: hypothetical protein A3E92_01100 [Candidatus Taylorbacteria bacterium RIFCSPHIGHO2_12_FULL_42_34]OHA30662.1 MAG: hypothetical protein A3B09_00510 [Candidatus Taylorbacteria bacterium RIFCSPLOWO2_01_FULL_43_83]OHA38190.1 MAG: hypothetical protein A3H58_04445 [Candi